MRKTERERRGRRGKDRTQRKGKAQGRYAIKRNHAMKSIFKRGTKEKRNYTKQNKIL